MICLLFPSSTVIKIFPLFFVAQSIIFLFGLNFFGQAIDSSKLNKSIFHHIGVYGFQKQFLKEYISQRPTKRELEEKLEQLRVSENTKIGITVIEEEILGVDTKEDLDTVNQLIQDHG